MKRIISLIWKYSIFSICTFLQGHIFWTEVGFFSCFLFFSFFDGFLHASLIDFEDCFWIIVQVREARATAEKAQQLLQIVANRKRSRHLETNELVITKAVYGSSKALKKADESREENKESASDIIDVTIPLNFLINDSGQLKVHFF